jgi:endonuclease III
MDGGFEMGSTGGRLAATVDRLAAFHGTPPSPPTRDAFELILYENVAYLAPDERRLRAFHQLEATVGTRPEAILAASPQSLEAVTSHGILKGTSAAKIRRCAEILHTSFRGDLRPVLAEPVDRAKRALQRFPGIGEPGAEKILLFCAGRPFLAPDSNGLRVLVRLGLVQEQSSYARTYAAARSVAQQSGMDVEALQRAHAVLRMHGQRLCKSNRPHCSDCPLQAECPSATGR